MSYILDALKKSDQDRQRRKPAGLDAIYMPGDGKPKKKMRWVYLIACALTLNAALLLWWLRPWNPGVNPEQRRGEVPKEQPVKIAKETGQKPPAVSREKPGVRGGQKQEGIAQAQKESREQPVPQTTGKPEEKNDRQREAAEQPAAIARNALKTQAATDQAAAVSRETVPNDEPKSAPEPLPKPAQGRVAPEPVPAGAAKPSPPAATSSAKVAEPLRVPEASMPENLSKRARAKAAVEAKMNRQHTALEQSNQVAGSRELVSDLKSLTASEKPAGKTAGSGPTGRLQDLPSTVRESVPRLSVSMLIYSSKPGDRYININGSRMREGQEVSAGLKVEEITPDGAVFSFQGYRFYKPVIGD